MADAACMALTALTQVERPEVEEVRGRGGCSRRRPFGINLPPWDWCCRIWPDDGRGREEDRFRDNSEESFER